MDDFVKSILLSWNCDESILKTFEDDEEIRRLIPASGPRLKFLKNFHQLQLSENSVTNFYTEPPAGTKEFQKNESSAEFPRDPLAMSTLLQHELQETPLKKQKLLSDAEISIDSERDFNKENCDANICEDSFKGKRPFVGQKLAQQKNPKNENRIQNLLFPRGVKEHLKSTVDGRKALKIGANLNKISRTLLVRCVVDFLFQNFASQKNTIAKEIFIQAANEIVLAYPNEREGVYFVLGKSKTKYAPKTLNRGKLWFRYCNAKRFLDARAEIEDEVEDECIEQTHTTDQTTQQARSEPRAALQYVKSNVDASKTLIENWNICRSERGKFLNDHTIFDYLNEFPVLRTQFGFELLLEDFNSAYNSEKDAFYAAWEYLSQAVVLSGVSKGDLSQDLINNPNDFDTLRYLPLIFNPVTVRNNKSNKNYRPSTQEMLDSFLIIVHDENDLDLKVKEREKTVTERGDTLQPFILAVGDIYAPKSLYIYVDGMRYCMESPVKAVDVCFKIFHAVNAVNASYPPTCHLIWTFIQRYIYKIFTDYDDLNSCQEELAVDLCTFVPELKEILWDGKPVKKK